MASETKKREVLQLLREYQAFHSAFGGAMPLDETGVVDATYGPAGYIEAGMQYGKRDRARLTQSYEDLENALTYLKGDGPLGFTAWSVLQRAYLSDSADPSVVTTWREKKPLTAEWHDLGVGQLAHYMRHKTLFVVWPRRMTSREEKQVERRNDEFFGLYTRFRDDNMKRGAAIKTAAEMQGYGLTRAYEIVNLREGQSR